MISICGIIYAVTALDNKRNNIKSVIEYKPSVEVQKKKCDSLYVEYISDFTAYQTAIINGEPDNLVDFLQKRYQNDSILLQDEMNTYFDILKDLEE